jgi:hypothetical protein
MWPSGSMRPDIAYLSEKLGRLNSAPTETDWKMALQVVNYLYHTAEKGIWLGGAKEMRLIEYVNADWARDRVERKSTTGYLFRLGESNIDWSSKKQAMVAHSTLEAEYVAASEAS